MLPMLPEPCPPPPPLPPSPAFWKCSVRGNDNTGEMVEEERVTNGRLCQPVHYRRCMSVCVRGCVCVLEACEHDED